MSAGRYSQVHVETSPEKLSDKQTVATFRPGVRVPVVLLTTLITAVASTLGTYFATHKTAETGCATSGEMNAVALRVDALQSSVMALTTAVNKNADVAHNETQDVRYAVTRVSDQSIAETQRLRDKLDLLLRK